MGLAGPLNIAFGAEYRHERYQTIVQDAAAYSSGGYIYPTGSPFAAQAAAIGAQGGITILPQDQADLKRDNISAYLDFSTQLLSGWDIGVAGRFEHYNDSAGNVVVGKITTRVELTSNLALRGTLSNGFRAPSLTQQGFASASRGYAIVNAILAANGLETGQIVNYFTNAIDTRTIGVDVVGAYDQKLGDWGKLHWSLGFNYNKTRITDLAATPAQLASLNLTLFDRVAQGYIEVSNPQT